MKKVILALLMALLLTGCSPTDTIISDKPTIVCTGFSQYDWVLNILGEEANNWNLIRLNEGGADMHSYQPNAKDMARIINADLIVYTGGLSEEWIVEVIEENKNFKGEAYCLLDEGHALDEVTVEGMFSKGHGHDHDHENTHEDHEESCQLDEHIWLSLDNAKNFCSDLAEIIGLLDKTNAKTYVSNASAYILQLETLEQKYTDSLSNTNNHTLIFADRFPFLYLAEDFGLEYFAAFPGCSAETEASFDTIIFLADKLKEHKLPALLITESSQDKVAKTIIKTAGLDDTEIVRLNSLQSVTDTETTYIGAMEKNLEVLLKVLN
ncbi:MAG: zinc ABC transporter substrate-binding protein [Firmicutes bacterium]|nr:zinc ABC transporter substrate-binding protein [Bacillota bacterium]